MFCFLSSSRFQPHSSRLTSLPLLSFTSPNLIFYSINIILPFQTTPFSMPPRRKDSRPRPQPTASPFIFPSPLTHINLAPGPSMGVGRVQGTGGRGGNSLLPPPRLNPGTQMPPQRGASQAAAHIPVAVPSSLPQMMPLALIRAPWKSWETLAVSLSNVPPEANTFVLWQAFKNEGHIFSIDLFEDARGRREHRGKIRFKFVFTSFHLHYQGKLTWNRPPPHSDFWRKGTYTITLSGGRLATIYVHLDTERKNSEIPSPVRPDVSYPAEIVGSASPSYLIFFD